jgi:hypothetical protein
MAESEFYTKFQVKSIEFWMNSAKLWKIGHHRIYRISANSAEFVNPDPVWDT